MKGNLESYPTLVLRKNRVEAVKRKHPWIFSGAIFRKPDGLADGQVVRVVDHNDEHLATGHYHNASIMIRVLSFEDVAIDLNFWKAKFSNALAYRKQIHIPSEQTNCYRLIHGEGDGIPGLIVDVYNGHLVVQCHSLGVYLQIEEIGKALQSAFNSELQSIYVQCEDVASKNGLSQQNYYLLGKGGSTEVFENGVKFLVDWEAGQKTGFFLDQRENRQLVKELSRGKSVLNCFCYTGGFSIYALAGGAARVQSIDISQPAMDMVQKNHDLNGFEQAKHEIETANVLDRLKDKMDTYDIVIVDPPAFAKSVKKRHNAIQAYKRLNAMAFGKVKAGGFLFTFSCSQVVTPDLFNSTVRAAAIESGKYIRVVKELSQGKDHPVNIYHPEGHYLKGLLLQIN